MLTDNKILIKACERNYKRFKVPTGMVSADKANRYYTADQKADLDIKTSINKIGEIINFSQILNSIFWDKLAHGIKFDELKEIYNDICQLDIMSNLEIDKAKKIFTTDNERELNLLKSKYKIVEVDDDGNEYYAKDIRPNFFLHLDKTKGYFVPGRREYKKHKTTMDYLQKSVNSFRVKRIDKKKDYINFSDILCKDLYNYDSVNFEQSKKILQIIEDRRNTIQGIWSSNSDIDYKTRHLLVEDAAERANEAIRKLKINYSTAYSLLKLIDSDEYRYKRTSIFFTLFGSGNKIFYDVLKDSKDNIEYLYRNTEGTVNLYGFLFQKFAK